MSDRIMIRQATPGDREAIREVAELDSVRPPEGAALLAFVDGALRAVAPLDGGRALADPFHETAELVDLLGLAVAQERPSGPRGLLGRLRRRRPEVLLPRTA